jgi:multiple sugar transport system permease protein
MTGIRQSVAAAPATGAVSSAPKGGRRRTNWREARAGYAFITPWIIGFLIFTVGAMTYSLVISFTNYNLATDTAQNVGTSNYSALLSDPLVRQSLENTLVYALMAVPLEIVFALFLASLLNNAVPGSSGRCTTCPR